MPAAQLRSRAFLALLAVAALPALAQDGGVAERPAVKARPETPDDQARFLAGLPVADGSPLKALQATAAWKAYARALDADWAQLRTQRYDAMRAWSAAVLARRTDLSLPVYYLFGGPDYLSLSALYPDAPTSLLCGLEPLGKVPQLGALTPAELEEGLRNLRLSLNSIIRLSFFKTNDMAGDLTRTELRGVLPLLYVFVARSGATLVEQTRVEITDAGELHPLGEKERCVGIPGVRLTIQRPGHQGTQELLYFKHNVLDSVIKTGPGFFAYLSKFAPANSFLKAASFLLHRPKEFGLTHDFLLAHSRSILQDDSGLPYASLAGDAWTRSLFGTYLPPRPPFRNRLQDDLTQAFKAGPVEPLPFLTGYRREGESNLVLAVKRDSGDMLK